MVKRFIEINKKDLDIIYNYFENNLSKISPFLKKLSKYTYDNKKVIFNKEELSIWNKIPIIHKKYSFEFPLKIYRGLNLSDEKIKETIIKFKKQNKKVIIKPFDKQFQSFTISKKIANHFSKGFLYGYGLVFQCELTNKNKFIDVNLFYCICDNLSNYLSDKYDLNKLSKQGNILFEILSDIKFRYKEQEIIIFNKLKVKNIYKSK